MAAPRVDLDYVKQIDMARRDLRSLIYTTNCAPLLLRLAWHDAGTYDEKTKTGGPNGSIRSEQEVRHNGNNGLKLAVELCEDVKVKHPKITYADLYQPAGVVAVEISGDHPLLHNREPWHQLCSSLDLDLLMFPEEGRASRCQACRCRASKRCVLSHGSD